MINVVLDTNIFRKNPALDNASFTALAHLANNAHIKLHIPYIVHEEFVTQKIEEYEKHVNSIERGLKALVNKKLSSEEKEALVSYASGIATIKHNIHERIRTEFSAWITNSHATLHQLQLPVVEKTFKAYFAGLPPFKEKKNRNDIPDSLILETIKSIITGGETVYVVVEDGALREACSQVEHVKVFSSLEEFIGTNQCQLLLKEQYISDNFETIIDALKENAASLADKIDVLLGDSLAWKTFRDRSIPDDNNEATIEALQSANDIELDFEETKYFGEGIIGMPFYLEAEVSAFYYIFKSDFYAMSDDFYDRVSISDHNDHYFEATEYFILHVAGLYSIKINPAQLSEGVSVASAIDYDSGKIDEITSITIANSDGEL